MIPSQATNSIKGSVKELFVQKHHSIPNFSGAAFAVHGYVILNLIMPIISSETLLAELSLGYAGVSE
jgi:hypothetical protein